MRKIEVVQAEEHLLIRVYVLLKRTLISACRMNVIVERKASIAPGILHSGQVEASVFHSGNDEKDVQAHNGFKVGVPRGV